jgi:hypothetical protein
MGLVPPIRIRKYSIICFACRPITFRSLTLFVVFYFFFKNIRKPPIFDKIPIEEPSSEILSSLACVVDYLRRDKEDSQIEGLQPPKSLCGKIMNVVIWEDSHWNFIRRSVANNQLTVGNFIHLRNVKERRLFQGEENTPRGRCH